MYHFLVATSSFLLLITAKRYIFSRPSPLYLVDFSCLKPPNFTRVPFSTLVEHLQMLDFLDQESVAFMSKVLNHSGQGESTYLPPALHYIPLKSTHHDAIQELHLALFPVFESLLSKTNISPAEIDVLIVNCSGFCPSPSLSSIIVNKYGLREDVKSFTISGMGCSASALAIDMAHNILKTRKDSNAVILSTEILSTGWYPGKEHTMMVLNCLFRWGAAAVLVTNKKEAKKTAKYKLLCSLRTQRAFDDKGYYSAIREEDADGLTGVTLRRDLLQVAGETLRSNITILGSKILPYTEIILYAYSIIKKKYIDKSAEIYVPNFKRAVQHFCLPTSGKPVIREIGKGLKLGEKDMEPALMTLHRFGNQSSSSLWYELGYIEAKERVKKGDRVWQLGMGSGPKCNSLVWECIRPIVGEAHRGVWADRIDRYPVLSVDKKSS
ncbi:3-ketoacyl-coa synthase 5 [Phtheirospermum japonicum]|uniref:3-ketoacyl-CoA synthase n=1 Tax=Phtheirospermum japonicum TaxID=374723 RepID=A0A830CM44_9LAMI|nr:3-ketoacyl-coa synthase 5 [Phtheirospermum japonicum]